MCISRRDSATEADNASVLACIFAADAFTRRILTVPSDTT
jgi:hypothetical protein